MKDRWQNLYRLADRQAAYRIISTIRCKSDDPFCGASVANEPVVLKAIMRELQTARLGEGGGK